MLFVQYERKDSLAFTAVIEYLPIVGLPDVFRDSDFETVRDQWVAFTEVVPEAHSPVLIVGQVHEHSQMLAEFDKNFRRR